MASVPVLSADAGRAVIDPKSYGAWEPLLDRFDELRAGTPVARVVDPDDVHEPFWLVSGFDEVMKASKDNATFLNNPKSSVFTVRVGDALARSITGGSPHLVESLVQMDAPKHPKLRRLTQDWFMPKNLSKLEGEIRKIANEAIDRMLGADEEGDFMALVAAPYPLHVVMQILGVPPEDEAKMLFLTQQMFGGQDEDMNKSGLKNLPPEQISAIVAGAVAEFERYFASLAAQRRENPTEDVATVIANAVVDGEPMSDRDTAGYYIIVASAGHDTTSASSAGAALALARDPDLFARAKADRSLLPGIVEEAIRWTTPVQHFMRTAATDTELGGQQISAGDWLMLNYVAANHDPAQFPNPRTFDPTRPANRHAAFGAGSHQCLGLHLARLEMRVLLDVLLDRVDSLELAGEPARVNSTFVGGFKKLPMRWTAA
ncbi:MAG: cytochrome [Novosphingobium sp. 17-62-19]|uniref:cytochrome P450 n=1 Tax=Novosphingobium sp. 17-62-19 TaxID=1970406 RepID=UPI000BC492D3|nr:cytochrome P450 [Novosphingobium sp. 17-62-19]OYX94230.1 MAG: cytochrome [Novosphingobium sp. 35-62-5]OZA17956.1 MAG: cytochrome [Novosphingobium sp. 17-62-19]HQS97419.1 cytochrome P450 [Novosphingobium sp.]